MVGNLELARRGYGLKLLVELVIKSDYLAHSCCIVRPGQKGRKRETGRNNGDQGYPEIKGSEIYSKRWC